MTFLQIVEANIMKCMPNPLGWRMGAFLIMVAGD